MMNFLLSVLCLAVIILHCVAVAQILNADALPGFVKGAWVSAVLVFPVIAATLWLRISAAAASEYVDRRSNRAGSSGSRMVGTTERTAGSAQA